MKHLRECLVWLAVLSAVAMSSPAAEYLPVCEKCLNPRVQTISGVGSSAAVAEARVVAEDAAAWCATNRPRDKYCATEEVRNGGDGGRKSYKASADCLAGVMHAIDGYGYFYNGVWTDGAGKGRARLKDAGNASPQWHSIVSGYGVARSEWDRYGGYSLTRQWEVLCGSTKPAVKTQGGSPAAAPRAQAAAPRTTAAPVEWLASCFRCPAPAVTSKSGIGTAQAVAEARMTTEEIRNSCADTDPQNVEACVRREMAEAGRKVYRATADCTAGRITTIDEQQYTLAGLWDNTDIGGGRTQWRGADGRIVGRDNASGGLGISQQWELLCPAPVTPALLAQVNRTRQQRSSPAAAPAPGPSAAVAVCTGKRYCDEVPSFAAIVRDFRTSAMADSTRMVSATVRFLNKTNRPLILGYLRNAGVAIDDQGNRYVLPSAASVRAIGEIAGRDFDPKFTIQPAQTADARFEFVWRPNGREIIGNRAWDVELAVREVNEVAAGQYRFGQEHTIEFKSVPPAQTISSLPGQTPANAVAADRASAVGAPTAAAPPAAAPAAALAQQVDHCAGKRGCHDAGTFVAEVRNAMLTREGNAQNRVVRIDVQIRNTSSQPISLAYVVKSSVLVDDLGNRFFWGTAGTYDTSATGIGKVEANRADPQFTLAPGQSRNATFTLWRRAARTSPDGTGYTYNVSLAQLEVLANGQQIRTTREHALSFTDFGVSLPGAGASAPAARPQQQSIRDLGTAIRRGLERKK